MAKKPLPFPEDQVPTADQMLNRLYAIEPNSFETERIAENLRGKRNWISAFTIPVSAILLVSMTLIGTFLSDRFVVSFLISALLVYWIGKIVEFYDKSFDRKARIQVLNHIAETETDYAFLPHFKSFLPNKYQHLVRALSKQNFFYIVPYAKAIQHLQRHLDHDAFRSYWHLSYPQTKPQQETQVQVEI
ncbi:MULTISPECIES: hypothetical protein [Thiomicrorhabdus]|uniref:YcxB family protein n=1 Tax=Thiomicrorhabdus heinhorstiae TaxID=2748010 RepID=A0ABS0BTM1_9GAMM|nr:MULTISPECIES: hypothetical protein [Thiomicrorhabdus]MBF6057178.1 hypothetical protein [Thiomicrorhabdus heinhorstiae]